MNSVFLFPFIWTKHNVFDGIIKKNSQSESVKKELIKNHYNYNASNQVKKFGSYK